MLAVTGCGRLRAERPTQQAGQLRPRRPRTNQPPANAAAAMTVTVSHSIAMTDTMGCSLPIPAHDSLPGLPGRPMPLWHLLRVARSTASADRTRSRVKIIVRAADGDGEGGDLIDAVKLLHKCLIYNSLCV